MSTPAAATPDTDTPGDVIDIALFVNFVKSGGNTRRGQYFYSFDPDLIVVRKPQTRLVLTLDKEVPKHFRITDLVTSDSKFQFGKPQISSDGRSVATMNANTEPQLAYVVVLVEDTDRNELVACDPQVINSPEGTTF